MALNNLPRLICHKIRTNKPTNHHFSVIVSTCLWNNLPAFKINSSDILLYSFSIAVFSKPKFGWQVAFVLFSKMRSTKCGTRKKLKLSTATDILTNNATTGIKKHVFYKETASKKNVVYRTTVKTGNSFKQYIDAMVETVKQRIYTYKLSFSYRNYSTNTSTHISKGHEDLTHHYLGNT